MKGPHFLVLSGQDQVGKTLQSRLLAWVVAPSLWLHFPDYDHWSGAIIDAILHGRQFMLNTSGPDWWYEQKKDPYIFQMLQAISRQHRKPEMVTALHDGISIVCDRFSIEGLCYGKVDGCDLEWLLAMERTYLQPDLTLILAEERRFKREDDTPDLNEACDEFQANVRHVYEVMARFYPQKYHILHLPKIEPSYPNRLLLAQDRHERIIHAINQKLRIDLRPLTFRQIARLVEETGVPTGELPADTMTIRVPTPGQTREAILAA